MITDPQKCEIYYQALPNRDSHDDGIFYAGIITTRIFCHVTCPARKPKIENCQFFTKAETALLAGFRPCKRCQPLSYPHEISPIIKKIVKQVEKNLKKDGSLDGYGGGLERKAWLLNHEKNHMH